MKGMKEWTDKNGLPQQDTEGMKPKGLKRPKQTKAPPPHDKWGKLGDCGMRHELANQLPQPELTGQTISVFLRSGTHPKTRVPQWQGRYQQDNCQAVKVVCNPYPMHDLPATGEKWEVRIERQIPGIAFGSARQTTQELELLEQAEHNVFIDSVEHQVRRAYFGPEREWVVRAFVDDGKIPVFITVPEAETPPLPGETWRVRKKQRTFSGIEAEPVERQQVAETPCPFGEVEVELTSLHADPRRVAEDELDNEDPFTVPGTRLDGWTIVTDEHPAIYNERELWLIKVTKAIWETKIVEVKPLRPVVSAETEEMLLEKLAKRAQITVYVCDPVLEEYEPEDADTLFPSLHGDLFEATWERQEDGFYVRLELLGGMRGTGPSVRVKAVRWVGNSLRGLMEYEDRWDFEHRRRDYVCEIMARAPRE